MKNLIGLAVLLLSMNTLACPTLSGTYSCDFEETPITYSTSVQDGVTVYHVVSATGDLIYRTDGTTPTIIVSENPKSQTLTSCPGDNKILGNNVSTDFGGSQLFCGPSSTLVRVDTLSMTTVQGDKLVMKTKQNITCADGRKMSGNAKGVCWKIN